MDLGRKFSQSYRETRNPGTRDFLLDINSMKSEKRKNVFNSTFNFSKSSIKGKSDTKSTTKNRASDSVSSYSYSRNDSSTSDGSAFDSLQSTDDGDLPTVHFDTNHEKDDSSSYFSFSDQRSRQNSFGSPRGSSEEHSSGDSDLVIPIFRFSSKNKETKKRTETIQPELEKVQKHEHIFDKSSQGSYHTKAPPIKEIKDFESTTTTTQTGQFNTPAPFFIPMLDTPADIKVNRDNYSSKTAKKTKERKPPPALFEERKSYAHVQPKYEAPLQKAVEAYRKAALEEKEQQKKREEERKKTKKVVREQQEAFTNDAVGPGILTAIEIPEDDEAPPMPKQKTTKKKGRVLTEEAVDNSFSKRKNDEPHSLDVKAVKPKKGKKKKGKKRKAKNVTQHVVSSEDTSYEEESGQVVRRDLLTEGNPVPDSLQGNYDINDGYDERLPPVSTPLSTLSSMNTDEKLIGKIKLNTTSNDALKKIMNSEPDDLGTVESFFRDDKSVKKERPIGDDDIESIHEDEINNDDGSEYDFDDDSGSPFKFQRPKFIAEGDLGNLELSTGDSGAQINTYSLPAPSSVSPDTNKANVDTSDIVSVTPPELESNAISENGTDSILTSRISSNRYDSRKAVRQTGDFELVEDIELESFPKDAASFSAKSTKSTKSKKSHSSKNSDTLESLSSNAIPAPRTFKKRGKLPILEDVDRTGVSDIDSFTSDFLEAIPRKNMKDKTSKSAETTRTGLSTLKESEHRNNTVDFAEPIYKPRPRRHSKDSKSFVSEPVKSDLDIEELMKAYNETKANNFSRLTIEPEAKKKENTREYAVKKNSAMLPPVPPVIETDSGSVALESIYHDDTVSIHTDTSTVSDVESLSSRASLQDGSESVKKKRSRSKKEKKQDDSSSVVSEQPTLPEELPTVIPTTQLGEERHNAFRWETYRNTQPTVSKSELMMGRDEERFTIPIENPTEPIKGWIKFQVGLIPEADTADVEQKASEKFDFEVLLKRLRSN